MQQGEAPGYKLAGWYVLDAAGNRMTLPDGSTLITSKNQAGIRFRDIALSADVADILYLYAEWEEDNIPLTFQSNTKENIVNPTSQAPLLSNGNGVRNVGVIVAKGYHFVSWTNNRTGDVFTNAVLTADQIRSVAFIDGNWNPTVFTANFAPNEYTIVFKPGTAAGPAGTPDKVANGAGNIADMEATYGIAFRAPAAGDTSTFWLDGYVFDGWMTDEPYNESNPSTPRKIYAGQTVYDLLAAHGGTITFTATWRPQTIKVTWIAGTGGKVCVNGDEAHQATTLTKSYTTISPSIDIVRPVADEGYRFVEWRITDTGETLTTEALLKLVKDGEFWPLSQSFTAIFRPITYTIAFDYARGDDHTQLATGTLPGPISRPSASKFVCRTSSTWMARSCSSVMAMSSRVGTPRPTAQASATASTSCSTKTSPSPRVTPSISTICGRLPSTPLNSSTAQRALPARWTSRRSPTMSRRS